MPVPVRNWIRSAAIGLVVALCAFLLRAALTPLWGARFVFTFAFPAVVIAAWYGRLQAGVICTVVLALAGLYYLEPFGTFRLRGPDDALAVTLFCVFGVLIAGIVNRLQDEIARSKELAEKAQAADMQRKAVLESIQDGFFALDRDGVCTFSNAQAERMLGVLPGTLVGRNLWHMHPVLRGTALESAARRAAANASAEQLELYYAPLDRWLQVRLYPAPAGGLSLLFEDVTEQKRVLDRLRESSSTLAAIIEGTDDFIYAKDTEGRFTLANRAVLNLLHVTREQLVGKTIFAILADEASARAIDEHDRQVLMLGRTETVEETVVTPFGRAVYLTTKSPRFDDHGTIIGLIGVATDITARKSVEVELRTAHDSLAQEVVERTAELVELSHHLMQVTESEKARLASELHDALGGSLTTLVLGLARLKSRTEPLDAQQAAAFAQVETTLQEVVTMTRRIIGHLRPVTLDTLGLAATLRDHVDKWSRQTGIDVRLAMPPKLPDCTPEVALTVFRIVQEALTNVAKHAYASEVEIAVSATDRWLDVVIEDNGVGIPKTPRRTGSHGLLGMRERAAGCGGGLTVDVGTSGRGTRIHLRLPLTAGVQGSERTAES